MHVLLVTQHSGSAAIHGVAKACPRNSQIPLQLEHKLEVLVEGLPRADL